MPSLAYSEIVIVETVRFIPQALSVVVIHRMRNVEKVFEELARDIVISAVMRGKLQRDLEHVQAVHCHPARTIGLLEQPTGRQCYIAIEYANVIEAEKASFKDVCALRVLAVHPPGKVHQQFMEHPFQELVVF